MSVEALWAIRFGTSERSSGGVVVLETGRLFGGDTATYFVGNYTMTAPGIQFNVSIGVHFDEGVESIFGGPVRPLVLQGEGALDDTQEYIRAMFWEQGNPDVRLYAVLRRCAELP